MRRVNTRRRGRISVRKENTLTAPPPVPRNLSAVGRKLDRAFREIFAGNVTVREVEIPDPGTYSPARVRATRRRLGVSIAVFAQLVGVSPKLVEHWEQGRRVPAPVACRLLDRINAEPDKFLKELMIVRKIAG